MVNIVDNRKKDNRKLTNGDYVVVADNVYVIVNLAINKEWVAVNLRGTYLVNPECSLERLIKSIKDSAKYSFGCEADFIKAEDVEINFVIR